LYINNLKLKNFRNYSNLDIDFSDKYNIIYGENAQGKTNILEAIFLCASARSHRTAKDMELIKIGEEKYFIAIEFKKENGNSCIELNYCKEEKKRIKINEISVKKIGDLMGNLNAVIFSPEDLLIIKEGPSERRRFIDITISQIKPYYFYDLQQYGKILDQRNTLLKQIQEKIQLKDTLEIWNEKLITVGSRIIKVRNDFIKRLGEKSKNNHYNLSGKKEKLDLKYNSSIKFERLDDVENTFRKNLEVSEKREIMKGTTIIGPQRDDYEIYLNDINIKLYGSQGQQRTSILSIKLSEIEIIKEETGENPVLLLDDVMSELDKRRQEFLLENLSDIQTFITCTDNEIFLKRNYIGKRLFKIDNGEIY
jgi:DNA replication and repair protein RecF